MLKPSYFIPSIIHKPNISEPWSEWINGSALYADISGFTTMAEALAKIGAEGAEILTGILNRFFAEMIGIAKAHGGDVMKFAGDSIFCCFPGIESLETAVNAAIEMRNGMPKFSHLKTPAGRFGLRIKIGISTGRILLGVLKESSGRCEILFAGPAVESSAAAEKRANAGEIIVGAPLSIDQQIHLQAVSNGEGSFQINRVSPTHSAAQTISFVENSDDEYAKRFLMPDVALMIQEGFPEFAGSLQQVVPVFLKFDGVRLAQEDFDLSRVNALFSHLTTSAVKFEGNLNGLTVDDKGNNFLFYFGAPKPLERKEHAATDWANSTLQELRGEFPEITIKAGMSVGRVYCGVIGGAERFSYAIVGDTVNLAARLMEAANDNQIWMTQEIVRKTESRFRFIELGRKEFKGKTRSEPIFSLDTKVYLQIEPESSRIAGRRNQLDLCADLMAAAARGKPALLVFEGDPGTGKSFLASVAQSGAKEQGWNVLSGRSEITSRNYAYFPWLQVLQSAEIRSDDDAEFRKLLRSVEQPMDDLFSPAIQQEQEIKMQQLHHRIAIRILEKFEGKPLFILLDELHWFDSLSLELLVSLLNHLTAQPVFILATARPGWRKTPFIQRTNCYFVEVNDLDHDAAGAMIENLLQAPSSDLLSAYVYDQCRGNPFLIVELIRYLAEGNHLLSVGGQWTLRKESIGQSFSGDEIAAARFKQMPPVERLQLQTAACMGPTFHIEVLRQTLKRRFNSQAFQALLDSGTFLHAETGWITFAHGLIQEAVYHSIPAKIRARIHRTIAPVMEAVLAERLAHYYPNLANHYKLAGITSKAIEYSTAAAKQLTAAGSNIEASTYWQTAYELTKRRNDTRKWDTGIALCRVWIRTGNLPESIRLSRSLRSRAKSAGLRNLFYEASILQIDAMRRQSDYSYLRFALKLIKTKEHMNSTQYTHLIQLIGSTYFWLGSASKAKPYLDDAAKTEASAETMDAVISANMFLAEIAADREDLTESAARMNRALQIADSFKSDYQKMKIRHAWAGILSDRGRLDSARETFKELLQSAQQSGDFYMTGAVLTGLGQVETNSAQWLKAEQYLSEAIRLFSTIGLPHGKAQATMWMGILCFHRKDFPAAYEHYKSATLFFEESEEFVEACHGYYNLAEVCTQLQRPGEAREWHQKGIQSFSPDDNPQLKAMFDELKTTLNL